MNERPSISIIHQLSGSGGEAVARALANLSSAVVLTNVHPLATGFRSPLQEFQERYGQLEFELEGARSHDFVQSIELIQRHCTRAGRQLVLVEWSHIDYFATPYVNLPRFQSKLVQALSARYRFHRLAIIRHPREMVAEVMHQFGFSDDVRCDRILLGMRLFAEHMVSVKSVRYDDFQQSPGEVLRTICDLLGIPCDASPSTQSPLAMDAATAGNGAVNLDDWPALIVQMQESPDYRAALKLLRYEDGDDSRLTGNADAGEMTRNGSYLLGRANRFSDEERWEDAATLYEHLLKQAPHNAAALNNMGFALLKTENYDRAELYLRRLLELQPDSLRGTGNLCLVYERTKQRLEAISCRRQLARMQPRNAEHPFQLANHLVAMGRADESLECLRRALELNPRHLTAAANYLFYLNYSDCVTAEFVAAEHFRLATTWEQLADADDGQIPEPTDRNCGELPLRVGYVSCDFFSHPVGRLIVPVLESHDRGMVLPYVYHDGDQDDKWTERARSACHDYRRVKDLDDRQLVESIKSDDIDILVDLGGYTNGGKRMGLFSRRPAAVQVSYLGYPNTTGTKRIDYRITDEYSDPTGDVEHLYAEKLIRVKSGFLCHPLPRDLPPVSRSPESSTGFITFGSFNNPAKISPSTIRVWAQIMRRVAGSRIHFQYGKLFADKAIQERFREAFFSYGVSSDRLVFRGRIPDFNDHLLEIGTVDIALDPFPYQGTMTTFDIIFASVPLISLEGRTQCGRVTSAITRRLGLTKLVATTEEHYVELASALANSTDKLRALRISIRDIFAESQMASPKMLTRQIEEAFYGM